MTRRSPDDFIQLNSIRIRLTDLSTGKTVNEVVERGEFEIGGPLSHAGVMDAGTGRTIYTYTFDEAMDQWSVYLSNAIMDDLGKGRTSLLVKVFTIVDGKMVGQTILWDAEGASQILVRGWNVLRRIGLWWRLKRIPK